MAAAFLFSVPGPKMIWQFEELGYEIGIDVNGRTGEKPIHWEYATQTARKALYTAYARFINLKKTKIFISKLPIISMKPGLMQNHPNKKKL